MRLLQKKQIEHSLLIVFNMRTVEEERILWRNRPRYSYLTSTVYSRSKWERELSVCERYRDCMFVLDENAGSDDWLLHRGGKR
jgi:hypothetical protein